MKRHPTIVMIFASLALLLLSCAAEQNEAPRPGASGGEGTVTDQMPYNELSCDWSGELIRNARYGARAVNGTDTWHFRSVEDLVRWMKAGDHSADSLELYVVDFIHGKRFIGIHDAVYLHSRLRPSPGGHHLSALDKTNEHMKNRVYEAYPGAYLSWDEMIALFEDA